MRAVVVPVPRRAVTDASLPGAPVTGVIDCI
ncbi:hypothetical protein MICRO11B_120049 [Micrococcus luteus]|nr:hypothetical protein MICRO116_200030 [Micrococcus sp. 116]VXB01737.1 hypothetical protein MICRO11B_120049 [Micrococcus luteus]